MACGDSAVAPRWHRQTKRGGPNAPLEERGDCTPACIASILGLPLTAVPSVHGDGWWERLHDALAEHGYCITVMDPQYEPPRGLWIALVPSLNLGVYDDGRPVMHTVVCRFYDLIHDPALGRRYDQAQLNAVFETGGLGEGWVLSPIDPVVEAYIEAVTSS